MQKVIWTKESDRLAYADKIFKDNLRNVLENGVWDTGYNVRPRWEDGKPAHTKYVTMTSDIYDIAKDGIPITTLRPVAWKTAIKEILWMWVDKSNDVNSQKKWPRIICRLVVDEIMVL